MGQYEPRWSAEEQTMIDMVEMGGGRVEADINREYTFIHLFTPNNPWPLMFRADTEYEAIRKAFKYWTGGKRSKYD